MKLIIALTVILAISNYANTAAAACAAASWCQSCGSAASICSSCYNFAQGTNKNKIWATSTSDVCTGTNPLPITDCLVYSSNMVGGDGVTGSTKNVYVGLSALPVGNMCSCCNGKKFSTWTSASAGTTCTDTAPTMTSGTCAEISNCRQTMCQTNATSNSVFCIGCSNGAWPATASSGATLTCTTTQPTGAIANCYYNGNSGTGSTITHTCGGCNTGFAVNTSGTCTAHTASEGCMSLQTDATNCATCWPAYYFSGALCVLKSFVGVLVGFAAFITLLILQ